ncbi:hypothetical protein [Streptomyces sp. NPDC054783]
MLWHDGRDGRRTAGCGARQRVARHAVDIASLEGSKGSASAAWPPTSVDLSALTEAELKAVRYWRPQTLGEPLFKCWN